MNQCCPFLPVCACTTPTATLYGGAFTYRNLPNVLLFSATSLKRVSISTFCRNGGTNSRQMVQVTVRDQPHLFLCSPVTILFVGCFDMPSRRRLSLKRDQRRHGATQLSRAGAVVELTMTECRGRVGKKCFVHTSSGRLLRPVLRW